MSENHIRLENINFDVPPPGSRRAKKQKAMSWKVPWFVSVITLGILLVLMYIYYHHPIRPEMLYTSDFYFSMWETMIPLKTNLDVFVFVVFFVALYFFVTSMLYNVFDCIALPFWCAKRKGDKNLRKNVRYWVVRFFYLLPLNIPKWLFVWWVGMLFGIFGCPNPLTKEGREEMDDLYPARGDSGNESDTDRVLSERGKRPSNAMEQFTRDYVDAAAYAHTHGGPIHIEHTYGLKSEEIQIAVANAEAYLHSLGYD